jgi:[amino group carrier protein]-lysine/ornithine hydrolase
LPALIDDGQRLLQDLVAIPSLSGQEAAASAFLRDWLASHGFQAFVDEAGNAVGVLEGESEAEPLPQPLPEAERGATPLFPGREGEPHPQPLPEAERGAISPFPTREGGQGVRSLREIVLLGHIDTVPGRLPVLVQDGQLYGRGSVDAKGPLVAFATAAAQAGPQPGWRIVVVGAVEEEAASSKGARSFAPRHRPDLAVIGEPSGWQRVTMGYKGRLLAEASVHQGLSHRSGRLPSACEVAVSFWNAITAHLEVWNAGRERAWDQILPALLGFASSDDGVFEEARLKLGFRLPPDMGPEELKPVLHGLAGDIGLLFRGEEVAYQAEKDSPLARSFLRAIRETGGRPGFLLKTGTSDMNVVGPIWRCPILAYGPGDSSLDHTPEEHIDLQEWSQGVEVLTNVLRSLG